MVGALSSVRKKKSIPTWLVHDFRTTFRAYAVRATEDGGLAIPGHVADGVLGHKEATLGFARYTGDRDRYLLHDKRDAMHGPAVCGVRISDENIICHSKVDDHK